MYRICINKLNNEIIELQSGGWSSDEEYQQTNLNTLKINAINQGFNKNEIEVKFITNGEYNEILAQKQQEQEEIEYYSKFGYYIQNENNEWIIDLELYKDFKLKEVKKQFEDSFVNGKFLSNVIGIEVDCRRSGINNDLQNVDKLIKRMERQELLETDYVGYSEIITVTLSQLKELSEEMDEYGALQYLNKWQLEAQIKAAETIEELDLIIQ